MIADSASPQMIAAGKTVGFHIDSCIAPAFSVRKGDPAEQSRATVKILKPHKPPYNGTPEAMNDTMAVPMPDSLDNYVINNYGDRRFRSELYDYDGVRRISWELFNPKQTGPTTFTCDTGCMHLANEGRWQTFLTPGGGTGGGLSLSNGILRDSDLGADIVHPLLFTLPPRLFGLQDPSKAVNYAYCCGNATLPLQANVLENGTTGDAAWGCGVTVYLNLATLTTPLAKFSQDAQKVLRCLANYGAVLCDRDSAARTPEVLAVIAERSDRLIAIAKETANALKLTNFFVGPIGTRFNYHTKNYPAS